MTTEMKNYYIDLGTFEVEAENEQEAYLKAFKLIREGKELIQIVNVEEI